MSSVPARERGIYYLDALYIQANALRREKLIDVVRLEAGIGTGHHYKDQRIRFFDAILPLFQEYNVPFHRDNVTLGARLNQIFKCIPKGSFSIAVEPLLAWLWDNNSEAAEMFYRDINLDVEPIVPPSVRRRRDSLNSRAHRDDDVVENIASFFDNPENRTITVELHNTGKDAVTLDHDAPWRIPLKRFEFFTEDASLVLLTESGSRRRVVREVPECVAERLLVVDHIRVILWERGPQPSALDHRSYPLKVIS